MLEFLGLLLALVFALSPSAQAPNVTPEEIIAKIEDNMGYLETSNGKALENVGRGIITDVVSEEISSEGQENTNPEKIPTFNTESEKEIGEIPLVAVENAPSLVPVVPTATPTPTPSPTPPIQIGPLPGPEPIPDPLPGPCQPLPGNPKLLILCPLDF